MVTMSVSPSPVSLPDVTVAEMEFARIVQEIERVELDRERLQNRLARVSGAASSTPRQASDIPAPIVNHQFNISESSGSGDVSSGGGGGDNLTSAADVEPRELSDIIQNAIVSAMSGFTSRIDKLEQRVSGDRDERDERRNRRKTVFVGNVEYPVDQLPKQLKDPRLSMTFSGREDVDKFIRKVENDVRFVDASIRGVLMARGLIGQAEVAFRAHFGEAKLASVGYEELVEWLRERYRKPSHTFDKIFDAIKASQTGSVSSYLAYVEEQLALGGVDPERQGCEVLVMAAMVKGLKPHIARELRKDPTKLCEGYSYRQFKRDVIALDQAQSTEVGKGDRGRFKQRVAAVTEESMVSDHEYDNLNTDDSVVQQVMAVMDRRKRDKDKDRQRRRRPAFEYPRDYKDDHSCRYCGEKDRTVPLCPVLYKKEKGMPMSDETIAAIKQQLN